MELLVNLPVDPRRVLGGHLLSKLPFLSPLVSGPLTVHPPGVRLQFGVPLLHLVTTGMMTQDGPPAIGGAGVVIYLIEIIQKGTETAARIEPMNTTVIESESE